MAQIVGSVEVAVRAPTALLTRDLEKARVEVQKFSSTANSATASTSKQMDALSGATSRAGSAMAAFGRQFAFLGTLTAGFALYKVAEQFASFEYNMNTVRAVLGTTGSEMALLNAKAQELGNSTRYSADQVAEAMTLMAKAGLNAGQIMGGVGSTLKLAAVEGLDLASATETVVNIMTGMGLSATELDRAVNVLTKTSIDSTTDVKELGYAFKYAAGTAALAKLSLEDAAAAIGLMAQAGVKGSTAGTSLAGIIRRLIDPPKEAKKVLDQYSISLRDASGNMKPFVEIIKLFEPMGRQGAAGLQALNEVFGARPFQGMAALLKSGAAGFQEFKDGILKAGNVAQEVSDIQLQGLKGSVIQLGTAASGLAVAIGESGLGKALASFAQGATAAFQSMTAGLKSMQPLQEQATTTLRATLAAQQAELDQVDRAIERMQNNRAGAGMIANLEEGRKKMLENMAVTQEFLRQQVQVQETLKAPPGKAKTMDLPETPPPPPDPEIAASKRKAALEAIQRVESEYLELTRQNRRLVEVESQRELTKFQELLDKKLISSKEFETARQQLAVVTQKKLDEVRRKDLQFVQDITASISSGLEGAFRKFVETGKIDFKELARSMMADIAVIALRMAVLQPLFGGGQVQGGGAIGSMLAGLFHTGGTAGGGGVQREMPAALFIGAPRLHNGGQILGSNEVPAILNRGERVVPAGANDNNRVTVQIINNSGAQVKEESTRSSDGEEIRRFVIEETNKGMTRGSFDGPMRGRYGNQVIGTRR